MKSAHDAISKLLTDRLSKRKGQSLNKDNCIEIYQDIFFTLSEIVKESKTPLGNEAVNLLSQMYYDAIKINNVHELDPNIFSQRAKLSNVPTNEVALMATMLTGTPFAQPLIAEVKKRS